jgi:hypothetical protein
MFIDVRMINSGGKLKLGLNQNTCHVNTEIIHIKRSDEIG